MSHFPEFGLKILRSVPVKLHNLLNIDMNCLNLVALFFGSAVKFKLNFSSCDTLPIPYPMTAKEKDRGKKKMEECINYQLSG